jgi:hypothetical protein
MLDPTAEDINAADAFKNKITAPSPLWQTDFIYRKAQAVVAELTLENRLPKTGLRERNISENAVAKSKWADAR